MFFLTYSFNLVNQVVVIRWIYVWGFGKNLNVDLRLKRHNFVWRKGFAKINI